MFRQSRLFASKSHPFLAGLGTTERISIATSEGVISFICPPASSWRESSGIHLHEVDLSDERIYSQPNRLLDYTAESYNYVTVFQRDWTLYGSVFSKEPVAVLCLNVNIVEIPASDPAGLYGSRRTEATGLSEHESMLGAGYINGLYGYTSYQRDFRSGRSTRHSFRFTLSETKLLAFHFVQTNPPRTSPYDFGTLVYFCDLILDSMSIKVDPEVLARRNAALSAYALRHGGLYDSHAQILAIPRHGDGQITDEDGAFPKHTGSNDAERQ